MRSPFYCPLVFLTLVFASASIQAATPPPSPTETCALIEDRSERLSCYDALYRPPLPAHGVAKVAEVLGLKNTPGPLDEAPSAQRRDEPCDSSFTSTRPIVRSPFAYRWDLDRCERTTSVFLPYKPNYFMPFAFVKDPTAETADTNAKGYRHAEAKYQLSFKLRIAKDLLWGNGDLWGAYTQRSFWQVYSSEQSSPFRETNYEPELILTFRTPYQLGPIHGRYLNVAFNHQSNGRSDTLSRSWNRVFLEAGIDGDHYAAYIKPWFRINEKSADDDNPSIESWVGRMEVMGAYQWHKHVVAVTLRNNFIFNNNRTSTQIEWTYPLTDRIKGYVQYFNGYGESLIDYNHVSNSLGVGISLGDWL